MTASEYAAVQNAFIRMVIPMRREFGLALDVPRMRRDMDYAQFVVETALRSSEPRLLRCARVVDRCLQIAEARRAVAASR